MKSPFKFLDAYEKDDKDIFFGRAQEIEQLYALIFQTNLLLIYGQSGTGKTSLIQCGLANRFKETDWFELFIRRNNDINASLHDKIRQQAQTPIADDVPVTAAIQSLYLDHLRPVYLIFDQFEELFILGSAPEQEDFIISIAELLESNVACKIIFVMREEYIAKLYNFEKAVPALFNKRFRVETMNQQNLLQVITGTAAARNITLEKGEETARQIVNNIREPRTGVELYYLQVYLDKLYREAVTAQNRHVLEGHVEGKTPITFTEALVEQTGKLGDVLQDFLDEQTASIQKKLEDQFPHTPAEAVQLILDEFVSVEDTKQPMTRKELLDKLKEIGSPLLIARRSPDYSVGPGFSRRKLQAPILEPCLTELENNRILRKIDEVYELAHDSLAGRIAEKRSAERKKLLKIQKLIKDGYSTYEQTHTFLNKEALAFIVPHLKKLSLNEEESRFVIKSQILATRKKKQMIGGGIALVIVLAGLTVWAWLKAIDAETQSEIAQLNELEAKKQKNIAEAYAKRLAELESRIPKTQIADTDSASRNSKLEHTVLSPEELSSNSGAMAISEDFITLLMRWEGINYNVYRDFAGDLIIGVGHPLTQFELASGKIGIGKDTIDYRGGLTKDQVLKLLKRDLKWFENAVNDGVKVPLTQNQFEALVSFAFNVGIKLFLQSTLLKLLNQRQYDEVPNQLRRWVYAGGRKLDYLVNRRKNEIAHWNGTLHQEESKR